MCGGQYKQITFRIGSPYEDWEFELIGIGEVKENGLCYDLYQSPGIGDGLFNQDAEKILMYFNADILERVDYYFNLDKYSSINNMLTEIRCIDNNIWIIKKLSDAVVVINSRSNDIDIGEGSL